MDLRKGAAWSLDQDVVSKSNKSMKCEYCKYCIVSNNQVRSMQQHRFSNQFESDNSIQNSVMHLEFSSISMASSKQLSFTPSFEKTNIVGLSKRKPTISFSERRTSMLMLLYSTVRLHRFEVNYVVHVSEDF